HHIYHIQIEKQNLDVFLMQWIPVSERHTKKESTLLSVLSFPLPLLTSGEEITTTLMRLTFVVMAGAYYELLKKKK
ncbi:hypothetical protein L9F63_006539, partial [Diploptera punctata]